MLLETGDLTIGNWHQAFVGDDRAGNDSDDRQYGGLCLLCIIALLEVPGVGTFMVREGDEFNIDPAPPKSAMRIDKITLPSVIVETGMLGSIRFLR